MTVYLYYTQYSDYICTVIWLAIEMLNLWMKAKTIQDHLQGDKNKNLQNIF